MAFHIDTTLRERWQRSGEGWRTSLPEGWLQGRSVFGGLTGAMAVALGHQLAEGRALRSVTTHLVRPTRSGEITGQVRLIRSGRNVSFVEVALYQDDKETLRQTQVFVAENPKALRVEAPTPVPACPVESLQTMPRPPGRIPEFVQHVEMRWATGDYPFMASAESALTGYCRFLLPAGGPEGLIALLDVWPAPPLAMLSAPAPASTVSWSAHLVRVPETLSGWCYYRYETIVGHGGYHTCAGQLYDASGVLLAYSEQLVAVYA